MRAPEDTYQNKEPATEAQIEAAARAQRIVYVLGLGTELLIVVCRPQRCALACSVATAAFSCVAALLALELPLLSRLPLCPVRLTCRNNDNENIVPGLAATWGSLLCIFILVGNTDDRAYDHATAHIVLVSLFCAARFAHTLTYSAALSRPRGASYGVGLACTLGMLINGIVAAFRL